MNGHTIRIDHNSDCWNEIELLKTELKTNTRFLFKDYSASEIVAMAVDEFFDRFTKDRRANENQRTQ